MPLTPDEQAELRRLEIALVRAYEYERAFRDRPRSVRGKTLPALRGSSLGEPAGVLGARLVLAERDFDPEAALRVDAERLYTRRLELLRLRDDPYRGKVRHPRGVCIECSAEVAVYGPKNLASHHNHLYKPGKCPGSRRPVHRLFNENGEA